jgi:hypothetical protein
MAVISQTASQRTPKMKQQALLPQDGATFHGHIQTVEEAGRKRFRASCYAQLDMKSHVDTESPDIEMFNTEEDARSWIHSKAASRGFSKIQMAK